MFLTPHTFTSSSMPASLGPQYLVREHTTQAACRSRDADQARHAPCSRARRGCHHLEQRATPEVARVKGCVGWGAMQLRMWLSPGCMHRKRPSLFDHTNKFPQSLPDATYSSSLPKNVTPLTVSTFLCPAAMNLRSSDRRACNGGSCSHPLGTPPCRDLQTHRRELHSLDTCQSHGSRR